MIDEVCVCQLWGRDRGVSCKPYEQNWKMIIEKFLGKGDGTVKDSTLMEC